MKYCNAKTTKMTAEIDVLARALADLNIITRNEFKLKPEQEVAVKSLLHGKDVLVVLPTGYGKRLLYQMFPCPKDFEMQNGIDQPAQLLQFLTFVHLLFSVGSLDLYVASLVFMKGTSCCVIRRNFKWSRAAISCYGKF